MTAGVRCMCGYPGLDSHSPSSFMHVRCLQAHSTLQRVQNLLREAQAAAATGSARTEPVHTSKAAMFWCCQGQTPLLLWLLVLHTSLFRRHLLCG
jgi:hypothetical protein